MSDETSIISKYRDTAIGIAAVLGVFGVHLKPPDTTAAETTHKWSSAQIEEVVATQAKLHRDLSNLRRFVKLQAEAEYDRVEAEMIAEAERPRRRGQVKRKLRLPRRPPMMPKMSAAPKKAKLRDLGDMLRMDETDLGRAMHELEEFDAEELERLVEEEIDEGIFDEEGPPDGP